MRYPEIDYSTHPAYAPYQSKVSYDSELLLQHIREVDDIHAKFCNLTAPSDGDATDVLAQIGKHTYQILRHAREQNISILAEEWLDSTVKWTIADLSHELARRVFSARDYHGQALSAGQSKQFALLQEQGMYIADLPADVYADIRRLALEHRPELRQRALSDRFNRAVINVAFNSPLWKSIKRAAKEAGIFDVLSELKRNRLTLLGAGLEYSCPEQDWYQSLYSDVGLADSPMQYLHVDEGDCLPKSMIYVTSVDEENGATRAIPGSNRWEISECRFRMHKALDRVVGDRYAKYVRKAHYRPLARHAELRRIFMELPKPFQGSSHFGDDVLAGTELANTLAKQEIAYLSQGGQALVFDGPHLLHRGSLVKSGERMALQVIYRNQNEERLKSHLTKETLLKDQMALARKYARKFVMGYV
ncbi:MAG: phytanoyl-CoA dioxygenase family protein [Gallionella sp.]|nr:phytanoyl-CoA dioxygenase family protein [Gallionella sp.]MCK9354143.1 phytanoyl-CoA dioxygenase family protein [Gallionella sp.]